MKTPAAVKTKILLLRAWKAGVESVCGQRVTRDAIAEDRLEGHSESITHLLAVGKAAASMCAGALDYFSGEGRALVVTKYGHCDDAVAAHPRISVIESGHPVPDENSLRAGRAMDEFVRSIPTQAHLVMLVSGGASALAERLPDGIDLEELQGLTSELLAGGYAIDRINAARIRLSGIKGGKLLRRFGGKSVRVYAISDVPGDSIELIGGGIGSINPLALPPGPLPQKMTSLLDRLGDEQPDGFDAAMFDHHTAVDYRPAFDYHATVIGSNRIAREAAAGFLRGEGMKIVANQESLNQDIHAAAQQMAAELLVGPAGAYIWGGEPTVILPPKPGIGGRNQSLALALAKEIRGHGKISVLVAGTDGTDGPTNAAGGLIDGDTFNAATGANNALLNADAGTYLARIAALFKPGPTGTNVMDLAIAIKQGGRQ